MKNYKPTVLALLFFASSTFISCNEYKSMQTASKISELRGNPYMYQLSKSLLKSFKKNLTENGLKVSVGKLNLMTPLSEILKSPEQIASFKMLLSTQYLVPAKKMEANWGKLGTVKDLVNFVSKNGKQFHFYK